MPSWDPKVYLKFADHRLRPALDLLTQIPLARPGAVYDLGCGPGNITRLLAERWPEARVTGVDSSAAMLAKAREEAPGVAFIEADIAKWSPPAPADLLFSNATLQWLDDHARLFPRLLSQVKPGGILAVQMPRNFEAPSHQAITKTAENGPWRDRLRSTRSALGPVGTPESYYRLLSSLARRLDIWESEYLHVLDGDNPVMEWTKGTALRPYLDRLGEDDRKDFLAAYAERTAAAYPKQPDGRTLLPFRRIFIVAEH